MTWRSIKGCSWLGGISAELFPIAWAWLRQARASLLSHILTHSYQLFLCYRLSSPFCWLSEAFINSLCFTAALAIVLPPPLACSLFCHQLTFWMRHRHVACSVLVHILSPFRWSSVFTRVGSLASWALTPISHGYFSKLVPSLALVATPWIWPCSGMVRPGSYRSRTSHSVQDLLLLAFLSFTHSQCSMFSTWTSN